MGKYHLTQTIVAALGSKSITDFIFSCRFSKSGGTNTISLSQPVYVFMYLSIYITKGAMLNVWLSCLQNPYLLIRLSRFLLARSHRAKLSQSLVEYMASKANQLTNKRACHSVNICFFSLDEDRLHCSCVGNVLEKP